MTLSPSNDLLGMRLEAHDSDDEADENLPDPDSRRASATNTPKRMRVGRAGGVDEALEC